VITTGWLGFNGILSTQVAAISYHVITTNNSAVESRNVQQWSMQQALRYNEDYLNNGC